MWTPPDDWQAITPLVHGAFAMLLAPLFAERLAKATSEKEKKNQDQEKYTKLLIPKVNVYV